MTISMPLMRHVACHTRVLLRALRSLSLSQRRVLIPVENTQQMSKIAETNVRSDARTRETPLWKFACTKPECTCWRELWTDHLQSRTQDGSCVTPLFILPEMQRCTRSRPGQTPKTSF